MYNKSGIIYSALKVRTVSIIGDSDKTLEEIYNERPELNGITPERG